MTAKTGDNQAPLLRSFVERIQAWQDEKKKIGDNISEVYKEAKAVGFDKKALAIVVRRLKMDPDERDMLDDLSGKYWDLFVAGKYPPKPSADEKVQVELTPSKKSDAGTSDDGDLPQGM